MKPDYLYGTKYHIFQPENMFHHNSDTELLGRFADIHHRDTVLDIGCGNGALMLYAAAHEPSLLTGIDIDEAIVQCARDNLQYNGVEGQVELTRVQDYYPSMQFSRILCNPPYFATGNKELINDHPLLAAARHEENLRPDELFGCVKRLLKDNGTFYLVHRPERMNEILQTAGNHAFHPVRMRFAYGTMQSKAKTVLYAFKKGNTGLCQIEKPYFMDQRDSF